MKKDAQQSDHTSLLDAVAILDMETVLRKSEAAQSIREQIDDKREQYQADIQGLEETLRSTEGALAKQKSVLSEEAFAEKRKSFEKDIIEAQKDIQRKRMALERAFNEAMSKLRAELVKIVAEMADEKGVDLVLSRQHVVIVDSDLDLTEQAMKALDEKVKNVEVTISEE